MGQTALARAEKHRGVSSVQSVAARDVAGGRGVEVRLERQFFIDNPLVRVHFIIVMIRWTGLAPWEFEFPLPGSLTSTRPQLGAGGHAAQRAADDLARGLGIPRRRGHGRAPRGNLNKP